MDINATKVEENLYELFIIDIASGNEQEDREMLEEGLKAHIEAQNQYVVPGWQLNANPFVLGRKDQKLLKALLKAKI